MRVAWHLFPDFRWKDTGCRVQDVHGYYEGTSRERRRNRGKNHQKIFSSKILEKSLDWWSNHSNWTKFFVFKINDIFESLILKLLFFHLSFFSWERKLFKKRRMARWRPMVIPNPWRRNEADGIKPMTHQRQKNQLLLPPHRRRGTMLM